MSYAPIALFTYNRPAHTKKTLEALAKNSLASESELFIFSDGSKTEKDAEAVKTIREFVREYPGFKKVTLQEKPENKGLADSIIAGVTELVSIYGKVIVLEDDIVTSPYFLKYMNDALTTYEQDEKVMQVSGYCYPLKGDLPETYFIDRTSSWGWGTWKGAWSYFQSDANTLIAKLKEKPNGIKKFNLDNSYSFMGGLRANAEGSVKTWAVKWQAVVSLNNGLVLWPRASLLKNSGLDGSGTNCDEDKTFDSPLSDRPIAVSKINTVALNPEAMEKVKAFYRSIRLPFLKRVLNKATRTLAKIFKSSKVS